MSGTPFSADQFNGAQIVVSVSGDANDRLRVGQVIDTTTSTLIISDAGTYDIATAIYTGGNVVNDFVLFDFNDSTQTGAPDHQTGGTWSGVAAGDEPVETTLTDSGGSFASWMVGCLVVPDVEFPSYFEIIAVSSTTVTVLGDITSIAASGDFYRIHIPPGIRKEYGTLAYNEGGENPWQWDVLGSGSRYLWASYKYMPPMMGFTYWDGGLGGSETFGAQSGTNKWANTTATTEPTTSTPADGFRLTKLAHQGGTCLAM